MRRKVKEASKFMSLEKLYEIQANQYRGNDGQEYYPETVDSMIWNKETKKDESNIIEALKLSGKLEIITVGR